MTCCFLISDMKILHNSSFIASATLFIVGALFKLNINVWLDYELYWPHHDTIAYQNCFACKTSFILTSYRYPGNSYFFSHKHPNLALFKISPYNFPPIFAYVSLFNYLAIDSGCVLHDYNYIIILYIYICVSCI